MIPPIFKKSDFALCDVPVPKGYLQSQTHSGVAFHNGKCYLVTSPYPNVKCSKMVAYAKVAVKKLTNGHLCNTKPADYYENPCLYVGKQKSDSPAVAFRLMTKGALMENPEELYGLPTFNSDPDILIDDNDIVVLNRPVIRKELIEGGGYRAEVKVFLLRGKDINNRFSLEECFVLKNAGKNNIISPCLTKNDGKYVFAYLDTNSYNDGKTFNGLFLQISDSLKGLQADDNIHFVNVDSGDYLPWHMSLFNYQGKLFSIIACVKKGIGHRCWQMLGVFNDDLSELKIYQTPLTDYASYRGAACVTESGLFVLYNTTVHEKIKGGKSVDGREVIMAQMPFERLIKSLKEE